MAIVVDIGVTKTLGLMKSRIADEIARTDLTSQIGLAIEEAIDEAATNRFWFNEARALTFSTVAGQEYYTSDELAAMVEIDAIWFTANGQRRNLSVAGNINVNDLSDGSPSSGEPSNWSRYGDEFRLHPIPRDVWTVSIDGTTKFPELTDDDQSNPWMVQGERYVRALAKRILFADVIRDFDEAQIQQTLADRYLGQLISQTYDKVATGRVRAWG